MIRPLLACRNRSRIIHATSGSPSRGLLFTKAVWAAMTACVACWRWSAQRCGSEYQELTHDPLPLPCPPQCPLQLEEPAFALDTPPIAAEFAVGFDHSVARDDHRDGVGRAGAS